MYPEKLFKDPAQDVLVRPYNDDVIMESHGSKLFMRIYVPSFDDMESTCPVVLMLHGYPGNERNIDIAQSLRMTGLAVVQFSYRGVWGSHGYYSLTHTIEDTLAVAEYIREHAAEYRIDANRLYLIGHSMGGFDVIHSLVQGIPAAGAVLLSPCDVVQYLDHPEARAFMTESQNAGHFTLPSENYIMDDLEANAENWLFDHVMDLLPADIPYAFIGGTRDDVTPADTHVLPAVEKLKKRGIKVSYAEFDDVHDYPASRVQLTRCIADFLSEMDSQGNVGKPCKI